MPENHSFTTTVARVVGGSLTERVQFNADGSRRYNQDGSPVKANQRDEWVLLLAFPKAEWPPIKAQFDWVAQRDFPQGHHAQPGFSWKYYDADTAVDKNHKPYSERPGQAGCMIIRATTGFQPHLYDMANNELDAQIVKPGFFVMAHLTTKGNHTAQGQLSQSPGIYMNLGFVWFVAYGEELVLRTAPDPAAVFPGAPVSLPAGASATPLVAGTPTPPAAAPAMPGATPPAAPAVPGTPAGPPAMPGAPAAAAPPVVAAPDILKQP